MRAHCVTLSVARMCALVESAYRIAAPTPRAPGIREPARMLSRCRWVRLSPGAADDFSALPPPQAVSRTTSAAASARTGSSLPVCSRPERARSAWCASLQDALRAEPGLSARG